MICHFENPWGAFWPYIQILDRPDSNSWKSFLPEYSNLTTSSAKCQYLRLRPKQCSFSCRVCLDFGRSWNNLLSSWRFESFSDFLCHYLCLGLNSDLSNLIFIKKKSLKNQMKERKLGAISCNTKVIIYITKGNTHIGIRLVDGTSFRVFVKILKAVNK